MIKYLLYNGSLITIKNKKGVTGRDLLEEAQLLYLTENIEDGYESSLIKS